MTHPIVLFWFRRDLRLEDNAGLWEALNSGKQVLPIFIFDRVILRKIEDKHDPRLVFIHREIKRLKEVLEKNGSSLRTFYGTPLEVFKQISKEYLIHAVYANGDYEPYAQERDKTIMNFLLLNHIPLKVSKDSVIFEKNEVMKVDGKPYTVFTPYSNKWKSLLDPINLRHYSSEKCISNFIRTAPFPLLQLEDMGFQDFEFDFPLRKSDENKIRDYDKNRDYPCVEGTTRLSLHIRFGTVSIRALYKLGQRISDTWLNELIWREFYQMIIYHFPESTNVSFKPAYDTIAWRDSEEDFNKWCQGKTGYPMVDAGMREMNKTGFMHNRVRMIAASFLTKHLLIDWRLGEHYFATKLLDYELASNVGGWQWAAGSGCDAAPYFRIFNPESQMKKFDPEKKYIRKWVPEYGTSAYPDPIVEHTFARKRCLSEYKKAIVNFR